MSGVRLPRLPRRRVAIALVAAAILVPALASLAATWRDVESLFCETRYDEAARAARELGAAVPGSAQDLWWSVRLATDPAVALRLLHGALARPDLPADLRARFAEETAAIEYARGRWTPALEALTQARRLRKAPLAGEAAFWADAAMAAAAGAGARVDRSRDEEGWTLQLAAYADAERARAFMASWEGQLTGLRLQTERTPGGATLYRVRLGSWRDREAAMRAAAQLRRERGLSAIVVQNAARP